MSTTNRTASTIPSISRIVLPSTPAASTGDTRNSIADRTAATYVSPLSVVAPIVVAVFVRYKMSNCERKRKITIMMTNFHTKKYGMDCPSNCIGCDIYVIHTERS